MGMTSNQLTLVEAVAKNDWAMARIAAIACCTEDTTQKNAAHCEYYKKMLETAGSMIELPAGLYGLMVLENLSTSFHEDRYYLSERERKVFNSIRRMSNVNERLAALGIPYLNATMLYGPSGTGKTMFGRYVAYKMNLPFCYLNFSEILDSYMGNTSKNIVKCFDYVKGNPCVFMLDEIDCITLARKSGSGETGGELGRTTITLMQELDKLPNNVIVIAATNRYDRIDDAIKTRFAFAHEIKKPNDEEKRIIIQKFITSVGYSFTESEINTMVSGYDTPRAIGKALTRALAEKIEQEQEQKTGLEMVS